MLKNTYSNKQYTQIFHRMVDENSDSMLTIEELYLYIVLSIHSLSDIDRSMITSVGQLEYLLKDVKFYSNKSANRKVIRESLQALVRKGYLEVLDEDVEVSKIQSHTFMTMRFNHEEMDTGYEKLYNYQFQRLQSIPSDVFMYVTIRRFNSYTGGFRCSYARWSRITKLSEREVFSRLDRLSKEKVITIERGTYMHNKEQKVNIYHCRSLSQYKTKVQVSKDESEDKDKPSEQENPF